MSATVHSTTCPLDCPDTCGLEVTVEDGRVTRIGGAADHPLTRGFICAKVGRFHHRYDHPERLATPLVRRGAKGEADFAPIPWDEALGLVAERLRSTGRRAGGEAILPFHYGGSNGLLSEGFLDRLLFARLGATRLDKTICAAVTSAVSDGMYGGMPGVAFEDYPRAETIVVWGANPKASQIHLVPLLHEARKRGAFVAAVDPLRRFSEREIDLHLPVLPGTDLPVALAVARRAEERGALDRAFLAEHADGAEPLLERAREWSLERAAAASGVEAADLELLADRWIDGSPAVVRCGWGPERNSGGGQAVAAILALPALTGKLGVPGGGYTMSNSGATRFDAADVLGPIRWRARRLNMNRLGAALDPEGYRAELGDPPVEALFVYNSNPAVTVPDQNAVLAGLARDDLFTVVFDQVMTDTARHADVVLPATTFLEQWEVDKSYGSYVLGGGRPVVERWREARPNCEVFAALGRALGFEDEPFSWDEATCFERVAAAVSLAGEPADPEMLAAGRWQGFDFPGPTPVQMGTVSPPDGKVHLTPPALGPEPYVFRPPPAREERSGAADGGGVAGASARATRLALVTPASPKLLTSMLGESAEPVLHVTLHPEEAERRGVTAGDTVRVANELGEVVCRLAVDPRVRPGVAHMPKGVWRRASVNGATSTALCPTSLNVVAGGACFNDARVTVEPAAR